MQIARQHKDRFIEFIPSIDQHLSLMIKHRPGIIFVVRPYDATADVRHHKVDTGNDENEVRLTFLDPLEQPFALLQSQHGNLFVWIRAVMHLALTSRIANKEITIGHTHFEVRATTN